jgi:signal peptidase I
MQTHVLNSLFLSLVLPGLGQLYNRQYNAALWFFLLFCSGIPLTSAVALWVSGIFFIPLLIISLLFTISIYGYAAIHAYRQARQFQHQLPTLGLASYIAIVLFAYLMVLIPLTQYTRSHQVEAFRIPSVSMTPTLLQGDLFFADKQVNCLGCKSRIQRGDVALFVYKNDRTLVYVKRVLGLPGDEIRIQGRQMWVNGELLTQTQEGTQVWETLGKRRYRIQFDAAKETQVSNEIYFTVPQGEVFVLGDNRDHTSDSRTFGTIPLVDIIGKATQIWFSIGDSGIRWERLGMEVL